jgi:hypothetical protein
MSSGSHFSQRMRGLSLEINLVSKIGRKNDVLETIQGKDRRSLSDSSNSSVSFIPITYNTTSSSSFGTGQSSSSQSSSSSLMGSIFIPQIPIQSTTNPSKVIKKFDLFQFDEDFTTTPWHVSSPLNIAPATNPLPKFKDHLLKFSGNDTISTKEHLSEFSNACHNIGANDNDTCM